MPQANSPCTRLVVLLAPNLKGKKIALSLEVGDKQPDLHNFNQGTHFYYKIQLQLQIIRILLRGILISL
jgi:hypothetical protein